MNTDATKLHRPTTTSTRYHAPTISSHKPATNAPPYTTRHAPLTSYRNNSLKRPSTTLPHHPSTPSAAKYYLASSEEGSAQASSWGAAGEREVDHCATDEEHGNACCKCVDGAECKSKTTVETMFITEGWYRYKPLSAQVLPCSSAEACAGSPSAVALNGSERCQTIADHDLEDPLCQCGFTGPM